MADIQIAPSILSADFARLGAQVDEVIAAGAEVIHVDVMDGHFVPPITMGPVVVSALREHVGDAIDLDVHLMIENPERHIADFAKAGASGITFHAEATAHVNFAINYVRESGCRAGLALNPSTPPDVLGEVHADLALCMTVNPGWGGQAFIGSSLDKLRRIQGVVGAGTIIQVDGGVDTATARPCADAGATWFVAGSAIFGAADPAAAFAAIAATLVP